MKQFPVVKIEQIIWKDKYFVAFTYLKVEITNTDSLV